MNEVAIDWPTTITARDHADPELLRSVQDALRYREAQLHGTREWSPWGRPEDEEHHLAKWKELVHGREEMLARLAEWVTLGGMDHFHSLIHACEQQAARLVTHSEYALARNYFGLLEFLGGEFVIEYDGDWKHAMSMTVEREEAAAREGRIDHARCFDPKRRNKRPDDLDPAERERMNEIRTRLAKGPLSQPISPGHP